MPSGRRSRCGDLNLKYLEFVLGSTWWGSKQTPSEKELFRETSFFFFFPLFLFKHLKTSFPSVEDASRDFSFQIFLPCLVNKVQENRLSGHRWCQKQHLLAQQEGNC